nr:MAG TPA: ECF sigma factor [Caudoviricetes sp.]
MIISEFTTPEINWILERCNFTDIERELFLRRSRGITLDAISEELNISRDWAGKISQKVNKKINKIL